MALRRAALWALLATRLAGGWGVGWDIRWHLLIGRDSFWIAPHLLTYASVAAGAALSLGVLLLETWRARRGAGGPDTLRAAGLVGTPGFHVAWWGTALIILAAPVDDLWHRLFGLDVTLWSPPHLLGFAGSQVAGLGGLMIAREVYPPGRARATALALGGIFVLGTFGILADPAVQTAFRRGGVFFFTHAILGGLAFTFTLVLLARLGGRRSAPLVLALGAVDPGSPIALAHEMARRNGTVPGRSLTLRLVPVLPAALMVLVDARRRWRLAAVAFGATLLAASGGALGRAPALAHALPAPADTALALVLTLAAALAGGAAAVRLAARLGHAGPTPAQSP